MLIKRILLVSVAILLVGAFVLAGCTKPTPAPSEAIELKFNIHCPGKAQMSVYEPVEYFRTEIERRTSGRVKIVMFYGATLAPPTETFEAVIKGVCDIGETNIGFTQGRFPASEACCLPLGFPSAWVKGKVITDFYNEFKPEEYDQVVPLYFCSPPPFVTGTTKKRMQKVEDFRGLTLRATGPGTDLVKALGAVPKSAPINEVYELLAKHVVDGLVASIEAYPPFKFNEVIKYVFDTSCVSPGDVSYVVMNKDSWDKISPEDQKIIREVADEGMEMRGKSWDKAAQEAKGAFLALPDKEWVTPTSDEAAKLKAIAQSVINDWIKAKTAEGYPAADYVKYVEERVDYWSERQP